MISLSTYNFKQTVNKNMYHFVIWSVNFASQLNFSSKQIFHNRGHCVHLNVSVEISEGVGKTFNVFSYALGIRYVSDGQYCEN